MEGGGTSLASGERGFSLEIKAVKTVVCPQHFPVSLAGTSGNAERHAAGTVTAGPASWEERCGLQHRVCGSRCYTEHVCTEPRPPAVRAGLWTGFGRLAGAGSQMATLSASV